MHRRAFLLAAGSAGAALPFAAYAASPEPDILGPYAHENLAIHILRRDGAPAGDAPLTLQEALANGSVRLHETKNVTMLEIENIGTRDVFVQAGDIVKGGEQDRVLTVSMVVPPRSGRVPVSAYCVEEGRWAPRKGENAKLFSSADAALPSREAKLAMLAPEKARPTRDGARLIGALSDRQGAIWQSVGRMQEKYTTALGADVRAAESRTSLQLSLENAKLKEAVETYVGALADAPRRSSRAGAFGAVVSIGGKIASADLYPMPALFEKMWPKLLRAAATEAVSERGKPGGPPPNAAAVAAFLADGESGKFERKDIDKLNRMESRDGAKTFMFEAKRGDGAWMHKNYLAK